MIYTILMILAGIGVYIWRIVVARYNREEVVFLGGIILIFWTLLSGIPISLIGFHYETGRGEHVGYVTAVQKQGVFFKTGRAYVKTDTQSSQEDSYCVIDSDVYSKLQTFAQTKKLVTVRYFSWISAGIKNCEGEGDIIYEVTTN